MMSNLGKRPIYVDKQVQVVYVNHHLFLKGKQGHYGLRIPDSLYLEYQVPFLILKPRKEDSESWGTWHTKIRRALVGVRAGFRTQLRLVGVGYRARVESEKLVLKLGYSHLIYLPIPAGLSVDCPKPTLISIQGIDWEKVYQFAAQIRANRPPEPYKGKGISYKSEIIRRKEGKKT